MLIAIEFKLCLHRILVSHNPDHGQADQLIESITDINGCGSAWILLLFHPSCVPNYQHGCIVPLFYLLLHLHLRLNLHSALRILLLCLHVSSSLHFLLPYLRYNFIREKGDPVYSVSLLYLNQLLPLLPALLYPVGCDLLNHSKM